MTAPKPIFVNFRPLIAAAPPRFRVPLAPEDRLGRFARRLALAAVVLFVAAEIAIVLLRIAGRF